MTEYSHLRRGERLRAARERLGLALLVTSLCVTVSSAFAQLHAGPVYTNSNSKSDIGFPRARVVVTPSVPRQTPLQARDLTLLEDGVVSGQALDIRSFDSTGYPLAAAVAIDVSGSMAGNPIKVIRDSLYKFVSDARPNDRVGVLTIADDSRWDVPFDADRDTLKARLQNIENRGKLTRLYDGLLTALGAFEPSLPARRELTVISDGHDEGSRYHIEDVIELARARGIAINAIGLTRSSPVYLRTLMKLASETGGSFNQVHSDQELQSLIENGLTGLKSSPVATFEFQHIHPDGKLHRVAIRSRDVPDPSNETTFRAPEHAANPFRYFIQHLPKWAYAALACVCVGLIVLVIFLFRHFSNKAEQHEPFYDYPPPPPPSAEIARGPKLPDGGPVSAHPNVAPPQFKNPESVPRQPAFRGSEGGSRKTRLAGVFGGSGTTIARLEVVSGTMLGSCFDVTQSNFWIGAAPGNDLVIPDDATVSSRHAYLLAEDPILILVDNQSTNGTRINGEVLRGARRPLHPNDEIQIGRTLFRVVPIS